jgi:hypothetical protein
VFGAERVFFLIAEGKACCDSVFAVNLRLDLAPETTVPY